MLRGDHGSSTASHYEPLAIRSTPSSAHIQLAARRWPHIGPTHSRDAHTTKGDEGRRSDGAANRVHRRRGPGLASASPAPSAGGARYANAHRVPDPLTRRGMERHPLRCAHHGRLRWGTSSVVICGARFPSALREALHGRVHSRRVADVPRLVVIPGHILALFFVGWAAERLGNRVTYCFGMIIIGVSE